MNHIEEARAFKFEGVEFSKPFLIEPSVVVLSAISFGEIASIAYFRRGHMAAPYRGERTLWCMKP